MVSRSHIISICATAAVSFAAGFYVSGSFNRYAPAPPPTPATDPVAANPNTLQGPATVYDGDTIKVQQDGKNLSVRIWGVDAPELRQTCKGITNAVIPCGKMSRDAIKELIDAEEVRCEKKVDPEGERNGRYVATCFTASGKDIAKELTRQGLALAYTEKEYGNNFYKADEDFAKSQKRGLWGMTFETPKQWRTCVLPKPENRPRHCPN